MGFRLVYELSILNKIFCFHFFMVRVPPLRQKWTKIFFGQNMTIHNGSQKTTGTKVKSRVTRVDVINKNISIHKIIHLLSLFKIEISFNKYEFIC